MQKYNVDVFASQLYYREMEVEADNEEDAKEKAMNQAAEDPFFWWSEIDDGFDVTDAEIVTWRNYLP